MEKRIFTAILLSMLVLYAWSFFSPPPQEKTALDKIQTIENKEDASGLNPEPKPESAAVATAPSLPSPEEKTVQIFTEKLNLTFSNKGGVIKKVRIQDYDVELPLTNVLNLWEYSNDFFEPDVQGNTVVYTYVNDDFKVTKTYDVSDNEYVVRARIDIQNISEMSKKKDIHLSAYTLDMSSLDIKGKKSRTFMRDRSLFEYVISGQKGFLRKNKAYKFSSKERKEENEGINWVGYRNRYYCSLIKPDYPFKRYIVNPIDQNHLKIDLEAETSKIPPKDLIEFSSLLYFGPEKIDLLKKYGAGFENIQKFYKLGLFDIIAKIIYNIMHFIHRLIPSWGVCIILMGLLIYFSMYPLTIRGLSSMKKMQSLQPKMNALKEKHKNNPQKLNQEIMELYKENKINPLGGCLPLFLQMPVFIGLYQVLWRSVSFKGQSFLWIKDLSAPDKLFVLPRSFPLIGNEINLLPILMMIVMFFQQRLSAKNMQVTDPAQASQQKMMQIFFPILLGGIFYHFASGLTMYFTVFYLLSTFTQWKISKKA